MATAPSTPFASAAGAPVPHRISTDTAELDAGDVVIPTARGPLPAYAAQPVGVTQAPVILVAQEIFGLHEHIRDIVRRFAKQGYFAIAPDYFHRHGDPLNAPDIPAIREIILKVPDAEIMGDFDAALAFAARAGANADRAAITGFCWGGRIGWLYAAHNPALKACIPWYGRLDGEHTPNQPVWPLDMTDRLTVPTLGLYGGDDPSIPLDVVEKMRTRLFEAPAPAELIVYEQAPHAFYADYRDSYRESTAKDAFGRALAWLMAHC